ncbi:MAG: DUF4160 domain-containing protein [Caldilineae bacterium]|nr:MAG: DUF4160 domain-containing protein [Caldilineae bacterium]
MTELHVPVILRESGYTFYFVMADLNEPPHVHVGRGRSRRSDDAKIWLRPVGVARSGRFTARQIAQILGIVEVHLEWMLQEWRRYESRIS